MPYIIQLTYPAENRYFIRPGQQDITVWGSRPRGAARFDTIEQAQAIVAGQLKQFPCDIVEVK